MDLLGDWWTPLVLRECFYGVRRFDEFQRWLGISRNTLTDRLRRLVDEGLLERWPYQSEPVRHEYLLTAKGEDLFGVLAAMAAWGDRWLSGESGAPITFHHGSCGHDTSAAVVCGHCGEALTGDNTTARPGPGYPGELAARDHVRERFGSTR